MMKRLIPALAAACLLAGCGPAPTPTPSPAPLPTAAPSAAPSPAPTAQPFVFTRENLPRLDGSTATVPLGQAVACVLLGETREEVADLIHFSKTTASYDALMDGKADLLLAAEAGEATYARRDALGQSWEMAPVAAEALVFLVNGDNPVDSLTADQVRRIYTGEITNWKQVGGQDLPIVPFQRNAGGGSQAIMEKVVMGDLDLMEPPDQSYTISTMEGLVEAVRTFDGSPAAIGYTVYYYAHNMSMADGLKLLAIDGAAPGSDTIRSGAYPFRTFYYAVTQAGLPKDSPTAVLYDWLLGAEGQALVEHEGYVSVLAPAQ